MFKISKYGYLSLFWHFYWMFLLQAEVSKQTQKVIRLNMRVLLISLISSGATRKAKDRLVNRDQ